MNRFNVNRSGTVTVNVRTCQAVPRTGRLRLTGGMNTAVHHSGLELIPVSATEWRVSDPALEEADGLSLLGFVQRVDGGYEATSIGHPGEHPVLPDLDAALEHLRTTHVGV